MKFLLHLKSIKHFLQLWDEDDESSHNEDHDQEFPCPELGGNVTVADRAESHHHKPECVKQGYPQVDTFNVVEKAHPSEDEGSQKQKEVDGFVAESVWHTSNFPLYVLHKGNGEGLPGWPHQQEGRDEQVFQHHRIEQSDDKQSSNDKAYGHTDVQESPRQ